MGESLYIIISGLVGLGIGALIVGFFLKGNNKKIEEEAKEKAYTFIDFVIGAIFMALFVTIVVFGVRGFSKLFSKLFPKLKKDE